MIQEIEQPFALQMLKYNFTKLHDIQSFVKTRKMIGK